MSIALNALNLFKRIFIIFLFLSWNLVFLSASPIIYESYQENVEINSKKEIHESLLVFVNFIEPQNSLNFFLIPGISNLQIFLDDKNIECVTKPEIGKTEILCNFDKPVSGKHFFNIEFDSSYPLIKINQRLMFRSFFEPGFETKEFIYTLRLPLGYIIPEEEGRDESFFISPFTSEIYSDGQRVILRWEEKPLKDRFEVSVIFESIKSQKSIFIFIVVLIALLTAFLFLIIYFKKKKSKMLKPKKRKRIKKLKERILEEHLIESEKAVITELKQADKKELWQKQLQIKTGFSKAKLSRVIRNLESRNLIQKIPFGKTNKIKLKV